MLADLSQLGPDVHCMYTVGWALGTRGPASALQPSLWTTYNPWSAFVDCRMASYGVGLLSGSTAGTRFQLLLAPSALSLCAVNNLAAVLSSP
jgi:hypothetical protein